MPLAFSLVAFLARSNTVMKNTVEVDKGVFFNTVCIAQAVGPCRIPCIFFLFVAYHYPSTTHKR